MATLALHRQLQCLRFLIDFVGDSKNGRGPVLQRSAAGQMGREPLALAEKKT